MGTHPIFESDFDCLTEKCFEMSLTGEELSSLVSLTEKSQDHSDVAPSLESLSHSFLQEISSDSLFRVLSGPICRTNCSSRVEKKTRILCQFCHSKATSRPSSE